MKGKPTTRDGDERILRMVRRRAKGWTVTQIMRAYEPQISAANVDTVTKRVMEADLKESGEPEEAVMQAYWKPMRKRT
jgi:uncharacterized Fe-S radical SAM superfamily protein PflX